VRQLANYDQAQLATSTLAVQKLEAMAKSAADAEIDASGSQRRAEVAAAYEAEQKGKLGPEEYERRYYAETVITYLSMIKNAVRLCGFPDKKIALCAEELLKDNETIFQLCIWFIP